MLPTSEADTLHRTVVAGEGELRCTTCGHTVAVESQPETCPLCHGTAWDAVPWRPFSREQTLARRREHLPPAKVA